MAILPKDPSFYKNIKDMDMSAFEKYLKSHVNNDGPPVSKAVHHVDSNTIIPPMTPTMNPTPAAYMATETTGIGDMAKSVEEFKKMWIDDLQAHGAVPPMPEELEVVEEEDIHQLTPEELEHVPIEEYDEDDEPEEEPWKPFPPILKNTPAWLKPKSSRPRPYARRDRYQPLDPEVF